ncbi:MAG: acetyl-CoA carboxylase biotin carboxylase subunit [Planctomycetes bacterium]|nr:acetyl-CoA carboxylase biotin carboxylase subunit [Planctomycetota bacterium]MBL7009070.1 acetyl-CoA carboxylase biotin carboxylase subunit [Planctomycetota bacterium]
MKPPFAKLLIANRGEIAVRVLRTCRDLGIKTVAVYSEVDRNSLHVRYADQAFALGGKTPAESYLRGDRIIEIALQCGAEAVHPGFGFLAENPGFAAAVATAGMAFVGPPPKAMAVMGDKIQSRQEMVAAGVPVIPGMTEPCPDPAAAAGFAEQIGYPVMLKASAGGGGKGIRVVRSAGKLEAAFRTASAEAEGAFGDGRMYVEKFLERPRHIEVQVLGDHRGRVIHLGERECSIQRRHQKLIEETPSPVIDAATRAAMGATAVAAAEAVGYYSAGTVEFLWSEGEYYFLEMNTRIQVEHAITEEVYGVDIVEWMIRIAAGQELSLDQAVQPRGHSVEVRINAEDPELGFLPAVGKLRNLRMPSGPGVRIDSALYRRMEVTPYYDSMLAKIIVHGSSRDQAIRRMQRALAELNVGGVKTSASIALEILGTEEFQSGVYDTGFLERWMAGGRPQREPYAREAAIIAALHRHHLARRRSIRRAGGGGLSPWVAQGRRTGWGGGGR